MADITGVLGRNQVSISSIIQHEPTEPGRGIVPLVIMTHTVTEGQARRAVAEIDALGCVKSATVRMRVAE